MKQIVIVGNLTAEAKLLASQNGNFISFTVAVNEGKDTEPTFFSCTSNSTGVAPYLVKGTKVAVSGEVFLRTYESNGEKRAIIGIKYARVELCGSKVEQQPQQETQIFPKRETESVSSIDNDLPF